MGKKTEVVIPAGKCWPNTPSGSPLAIDNFGATGEYKSGKTLLGLSIAPGCHPPGHKFAGQPRTLYLDFEKSGGTYAGTGCKRIDVPSVMMAAGIDYTPLNVFTWFSGVVDRVEPGQHDVIMADPVTDIEGGLVEYVRKNCKQFGLSEDQVRRAGGLLWGAVKDEWKRCLLKLSTRCQTFFFTSHLRDVWQGNSPTGKREPKGKDTLMELASLYLWLERKADQDGKVPDVPSAIVLKERLSDTYMDAEGNLHIVPLMPPRIPVASVGAIRRYIACPPDYSKLREGERVKEEKPTDEELMRLRLATAEAERDTEASRLEQLRRRAEIMAAARAAEAQTPQATDKTAEKQADQDVKRQAEAEQAAKNAAEEKAAEQLRAAQQAEIDRLRADAEAKAAAMKGQEEKLMASQPVENRMAGEQHMEAEKAEKATEQPVEQSNGKATRSQVMEILDLVKQLGIDDHKLKEIVQRAGVQSVPDLKREHALALAEKLRQALSRKNGGNGGN